MLQERLYDLTGKTVNSLDELLKQPIVKERYAQNQSVDRIHQRLKAQITELETTINVLLEKMEDQKVEYEDIVANHIGTMVMPYIIKLRAAQKCGKNHTLIDIIELNLKDILSPSTTKITSNDSELTPIEIKVANLVKKGYRTKEIASVFNCSIKTIDSHRASIRKKLGIKDRTTNLRTFLMSS